MGTTFENFHLFGTPIESVRAVLAAPVLHLWDYDGYVAGYTLFGAGVACDTLNSAPNMWAGEPGKDGEPIPHKTPKEFGRLRGKPEALLPYCVP